MSAPNTPSERDVPAVPSGEKEQAPTSQMASQGDVDEQDEYVAEQYEAYVNATGPRSW